MTSPNKECSAEKMSPNASDKIIRQGASVEYTHTYNLLKLFKEQAYTSSLYSNKVTTSLHFCLSWIFGAVLNLVSIMFGVLQFLFSLIYITCMFQLHILRVP